MAKNKHDNKRPVITFTRHTPYMVSDLENLISAEGKKLKTGSVISLCRCGLSSRKPYCDGSHQEKGIDGEKQPDRVKDRVVDYRGKDITIHDNRGICSHDGACWKNLPAVFKKAQKFRWIDPDGASVREIVETIEKCPSGALSYSIGGKKCQDLLRKPAIKIAADGPYEVTGFIELKDDMNSKPQSREHYTLCRCGSSRNKPFCDGSHGKAKFKG